MTFFLRKGTLTYFQELTSQIWIPSPELNTLGIAPGLNVTGKKADAGCYLPWASHVCTTHAGLGSFLPSCHHCQEPSSKIWTPPQKWSHERAWQLFNLNFGSSLLKIMAVLLFCRGELLSPVSVVKMIECPEQEKACISFLAWHILCGSNPPVYSVLQVVRHSWDSHDTWSA